MKPNGSLPKIENNVPMPKPRKSGVSVLLRSLKKGQSVLLEMPQNNVANLAQHALGSGNYTTKIVDGGTRVWRLK